MTLVKINRCVLYIFCLADGLTTASKEEFTYGTIHGLEILLLAARNVTKIVCRNFQLNNVWTFV